jgi:hypothetical protein
MTSWFWMCPDGCWWKDSTEYSRAIRANGERGRLSSFDTLDKRRTLKDKEIFCMEGLAKGELAYDLTSIKFALTPPPNGVLYVWGHTSGLTDLVHLVVATGNSAMANPTMLPDDWSQKGGPYQSVTFAVLQQVLR